MSQVVTYLRNVFAYITGQSVSEDSIAAPAARARSECRFRLDNDSSATVVLPDQRKLGYAQYGSLTGRPVLALHGLPGSRLEAAYFDKLALELGARIICVDRPGIGWSSPQLSRKVVDHPKDIEQLAEHLELGEYAVMGTSGGGPYALACAATLPAKNLKAVSVVVGLGSPDMSKKGMNWLHWLGFTFGFLWFPGLCRWYLHSSPAYRLDLDDEKRFELMLQEVLRSNCHEKDAELMKDVDLRDDTLRLTLRSCRESFGQGFDGWIQDAQVMLSDWGFRLEDIRHDLPIQLWYGKCDDNVPPIHGEQTAARLGPKAVLHLEDETHTSLQVKYHRRVLEDLLKAM